MTTLEPLFRLLVRTLSERQPERVHQPMSINELMDSILPYRLVRRELAVDSAEDYETLILRLCAGEGDFVQAEPAAQAALAAELKKPLADLALLRVYGDTHVVLRTDPLLTAMDDRPEERYAPPGARTSPPPEAPEAAETETDDAAAPAADEQDQQGDGPDDAWLPDPVFEANASVGHAARTGCFGRCRRPRPTRPQVRCPFCGGLLPPRMAINFCPHCGMGQDVGTCRACGADMDVGWRYCVSCGEEAQGGMA